MKLIYRKTTRDILGTVNPPQPEAVEIGNVVRSAGGGGVAADYAVTADAPAKLTDQLYSVTSAGDVVLVDDIVILNRRVDRASAIAKLKAPIPTGLGLTDAEIAALGLS